MSERPVYPVERFEVETVDADRVLLTVHYFPSPDHFAKQKSTSLNFLLPVSGVAPLAKLLNLVLQERKQDHSGKIQ